MRIMKKIILLCLCFISITTWATSEKWTTHFAYNSVQLIAVTETDVYALANGAMFSVNKLSEELTKYDNRYGLHGTTIAYIAYDEERSQLLILYEDGKMDIWCNGHITYISDLYNKRMTASKKCNNVTIHDNWAYLSMEFGILLFDLVRWEFKDTYYIGDDAAEIRVTDVMLHEDSIYAQTQNGVLVACTKDKLVDFRYWHQCEKLPVAFDTKKGKEYTDDKGDFWKAEGELGVYRSCFTGEQMHYLPEGPQVNTPYRMLVDRGRLFVVPGGRWAVQNSTPGHVMIYENGHWTNITNFQITSQTGKRALDFMNVAVDPQDAEHFFVTSYGTGVYEFQGEELVKHHTPSNSILTSAVANNPDEYTRTDGAVYDSEGRLWVENVSVNVENTLVAFMPDKTQKGINLYLSDGNRYGLSTPAELCIDHYNSHKKWMLYCREKTAIILLNDSSTAFDISDDQLTVRTELHDQDGNAIIPEFYYTIAQSPNGDIWVGSSMGPIIIPHEVNFEQEDICRRLRITMPDGTYLLETERINSFAFTQDKICIGTHMNGVYILNEDATEVLAHYTSDNTPMPSNTILSLAYDELNNMLYIGTGGGLVACDMDIETALDSDFEDTSEDNWTYGNMYQWRTHLAYSSVDEVERMNDKIYALSNNALFSVNSQTDEIEYYSRLTGLHAATIDHIAYNKALNKLLLTYQNGQLDVIDSNERVHNISDLYLKQANISKKVNDICMYSSKAYLAMNFGIIALDLKKYEIEDTYYIDQNLTEVNVQYICVLGDSIYAASNAILYSAHMNDNLMDFAYWHKTILPLGKNTQGMRELEDRICVVRDNVLWSLSNGTWHKHASDFSLRGLQKTNDLLFATIDNQHGIVQVHSNFSIEMAFLYGPINDILQSGNDYWLATESNGLVAVRGGNYSEYRPAGPISNTPYRMRFFGDRLYVLPGGRWAAQNLRMGEIMYYENGEWTNITNGQLVTMADHALYDFMNVAQDPTDKEHYFITTYGTGMLEMRGKEVVKLHLPHNSSLQSAIPSNPDFYTRTDGAMFDDQGNLWVLNASKNVDNVHIMNAKGEELCSFNLYNNGERIPFSTPGEIVVDKRNSQWKWFTLCRDNTGLILLQDNGTPTNPTDDKALYRNEWFDQFNTQIRPEFIYTVVQDHDNTLWVGTSKGIFTIPASIDFMNSDKCERIVIRRNDGTKLGDFLLDNEQVNCIAVDGANRKWIGTASSGAFLIQIVTDEVGNKDVETIAHFTKENSLLPSDNILSIAIQESTGEIFFGTSDGLVSYMSDAVEPSEDFSNLYVYPNPVYPNYKGNVVIKGLMVNTQVRILDANGNLVKTIEGNGGEVVWDLTNATMQRVASGVYTAVCNTMDGESSKVIKILIMN